MTSKDKLIELLDYSNLDYSISNTATGYLVVLTDYYQFYFDFNGNILK